METMRKFQGIVEYTHTHTHQHAHTHVYEMCVCYLSLKTLKVIAKMAINTL